mmetsp:Transcript_4632/g.8576  ORF Transcript_4632/g.8576 Transcript_4632/m.8576 type:complete len:249 (-) Transcript_4632:119-865(-)
MSPEISDDVANLIHQPLGLQNYVTLKGLVAVEEYQEAELVEVFEDNLEANFLLRFGGDALEDLAPLGDFHGRFGGGFVGVEVSGGGGDEAGSEVRLRLVLVVDVAVLVFPLGADLSKLVDEVQPRDWDGVVDVGNWLAVGEEGGQLVGHDALLCEGPQVVEALQFLLLGGRVVHREEEKIAFGVGHELVFKEVGVAGFEEFGYLGAFLRFLHLVAAGAHEENGGALVLEVLGGVRSLGVDENCVQPKI